MFSPTEPRFMIVVPPNPNDLIDLRLRSRDVRTAMARYGFTGRLGHVVIGGYSMYCGRSAHPEQNVRAERLARMYGDEMTFTGPVVINNITVGEVSQLMQALCKP